MCSLINAFCAAEEQPSSEPEEVEATCHEEEVIANIISVEFLDGTDDAIATSEVKQFVNLTRDAKWVDGVDILNIDRCSEKPRIKVRFDQPGAHAFKLKFVADGGNTVYTDTEKARSTKFTFEEREKDYTTGGDGSLIITDFFVCASGNDKYTLSATDDQATTVTSTGSIRTTRYFYYIELKMRGLASVPANIGTFTGEFDTNFMKLKALASVDMDHLENIGTDSNPFKTAARTAYTGSTAPAKSPYAVAIGYTDHLAVKTSNQALTKAAVEVGPGKPTVTIPIIGVGINDPALSNKYLWKNIVTGEDWFVSCSFLKDGGDVATDTREIVKAKCVPTEIRTDMSRSVVITVDDIPTNETGTLTLTVNWVDRMRGGISFGDNLICACTRSWWQNKSEASINQVLIHEMGHKVGMTPNGTGNLPDQITSYYTAGGHVGSHCHNGIPTQAMYNSSADGALASCVMYGATIAITAFCANCAPAVRKLNITDGWGTF